MNTDCGELRFILRGGLGNQLFQASAGAFYGRELNARVVLDDVAIIRHADKSRRGWIRKIDLQKLFGGNYIKVADLLSTRLRSFKPRPHSQGRFYSESDLNSITNVDSQIVVYDWFQSKKFAPKHPQFPSVELFRGLSRSSVTLYEHIRKKSESAAVHIRLGDFVNSSWGALPASWYLNALEQLRSQGIKEIHCFSDDVLEARNMLKPLGSSIKISFPELNLNLKPHEILFILSGYSNYVSSNSTLSWWACYLNNMNSRIYTPWNSDHSMDGWQSI
jgi:Glycosyl transferase family 11